MQYTHKTAPAIRTKPFRNKKAGTRQRPDNYSLRITVIIRPKGETQLLVRANAQYNVEPVTEASPYQNFFIALEKSMFLTAQQVD